MINDLLDPVLCKPICTATQARSLLLVRLKDVADISQLFPIFDAIERFIVVTLALRLALKTITRIRDVLRRSKTLRSNTFMTSTGHT